MQLEQTLETYRPMQTQRTQGIVYTFVSLESLSASALYIGDSGSSIKLTIRPIGSNSQLHIHEGEGGTVHIKTLSGEYQNLSSYDGAMLDLIMDKAGLPKIKR